MIPIIVIFLYYKKMKERHWFIDYAKSIGILLVILGHYVYYLELPFAHNMMWGIEHSITLFHMPLFFVVSGMLFRDVEFKKLWAKTKKQLIYPYVYLCLICLAFGIFLMYFRGMFSFGLIIRNIVGIISGGDFWGRAPISYSGPLWFCYSLILIKIFMGILNQNKRRKLFVILLIIVGVGMMYLGNILPFRIDSTLVGFIFFSFGFYFKDSLH